MQLFVQLRSLIFYNKLKPNKMQELITRLTEKAGLSAEQATNALNTVKEFAKEKFPMMGDAVDKMMGGDAASTATDAAATAATGAATTAEAAGGSMLDKISDVIPGAVGEKIEDFAKGIGDKIGGIFGK